MPSPNVMTARLPTSMRLSILALLTADGADSC